MEGCEMSGPFFDRALRRVYQSVARALDQSWQPPMTVWQATHEIVLSLELAGVPRDDIDIAVSRGRLVCSGVRKPNRLTASARAPRFRRSILLPQDADTQQISTELKQGILRVRVARRPPCTPLA
jgi:HSP20 family protein